MKVRLEGASLTDVGYTHETEGSFNVTKILASVHLFQRVEFPILASIIEGNQNADVCQPLIDQMTYIEASRPLVLMECEDHTAFVVDGNNRLRWLITRGYKTARGYFIPYKDREQFRMRIMILRNGQWEEENHKHAIEVSRGQHHPAARTR